ncbi:hypothetical protein Adi01nite_18400 [Amorphoplanes digitatis]|nr:hypothetical protein Adi01nite_18400 [Actinoplanes digitatis]
MTASAYGSRAVAVESAYRDLRGLSSYSDSQYSSSSKLIGSPRNDPRGRAKEDAPSRPAAAYVPPVIAAAYTHHASRDAFRAD